MVGLILGVIYGDGSGLLISSGIPFSTKVTLEVFLIGPDIGITLVDNLLGDIEEDVDGFELMLDGKVFDTEDNLTGPGVITFDRGDP